LGRTAVDREVFAAGNAHVPSDRARLLPRASLVREGKRLLEAQSIEPGRCPLCGQKVDVKSLARRIESALDDMMEAARDLDRCRDPILEQAEGLESADDVRQAIYDRARAMDLEIPPVPALPDTRIRDQVEALAPVDIDTLTSHLSEVRRWDKSAAKLARQLSPADPDTRDSQLVMLA